MRWALQLVEDEAITAAADGDEAPPPAVPGGRFHSLMILEDAWSGDYRYFNAESITWRDLPLPLMATDESDHGAIVTRPTVLVGLFDRIERQGTEIHGYGSYITNPDEQAARLIEMINAGELPWFSADLDEVEYEMLLEQTGDDDGLIMLAAADEPEEEAPADDEPDDTTEEIDGKQYEVIQIPTDRLRVTKSRVMGGTAIPFQALQEAWIRPEDSEPDAVLASGARPALLAAGIRPPLAPPRSWFDAPVVHGGPVELTITDAGQVIGHVAAWADCHTAFPDTCTPPPRSLTNYAYFLTGRVRCKDGSRVRVGQLTLRGGHADRRWNAAKAMAHYDDTDAAFADVAIGEDEYGIWVAGALRPNIDPEDIRVAMASGISGDWRPIGVGQELIALSSVNTRGFARPKARFYEEHGLVASMIVDLPPVRRHANVDSIVERIATTIGRSTEQRRQALYERVHG